MHVLILCGQTCLTLFILYLGDDGMLSFFLNYLQTCGQFVLY